MSSYRAVRVGELLQAEIAHLLLRQLKDPRLKMSTVSRVEVSPDLRHACVYISRLGSEAEQQETLQGFIRAASFIRGQLGKNLKLRYAPELSFKIDTAIAYGARISHVLKELSATSTPPDVSESDASHA
jgi:ribosome-binding factor A